MPIINERDLARVTEVIKEEYPKISYIEIVEAPLDFNGKYRVSAYGHINGVEMDMITNYVRCDEEQCAELYENIKGILKGGVFDNE